jgi:HSP20 family molecular chaperone IbpA
MQRHPVINENENMVYPGGYMPRSGNLPVWDTSDTTATSPQPKVETFNDYYKIEIPLPGVRREDILLYCHDHMLCLRVETGNGENDKKNEETSCTKKHIPLPRCADPEFASAGYKDGVLHIFLKPRNL